jgi:hypothetical protein
VVDHFHDLQLAVLEPLVLQNLLDGHLCGYSQDKTAGQQTARQHL